jgi:hypothetical protein
MPHEPDLGYHLRELRADLGSTKAALDELEAQTPPSRKTIRGWITVESALEHDLDVHFPGALKLLGVRALGRAAADDENPDDADAVDLGRASGETRRFVERALVALDDRATPTAVDLAAARDAVAAGLGIARQARAACIRLVEESSGSRSDR